MRTITPENAGKKIKEYLDEFDDYLDSPAGRIRQLREMTQRNVDHIFGQFRDVLVYLDDQALYSKRDRS